MAETVEIEVRVTGGRAGAAELRVLRGELVEVEKATAKAGATASGNASKGLASLESRSSRLHSALSTLDNRLKSLSSSLTSALVTGTKRAAVGVGLLTGVVAAFGLKAASGFQQSRIAFDALLGSAEAGGALFKQLQAINLKTPFQLNEIAPATQLLLRYGVAADKVIPVLKSLLDAAALTNDPQGSLQSGALAVGQIVSAGRIMGQDANQLTQAGIPVYELFAEKLGITALQARKLGEAGKLSSDQFLEGLINMEGPLAKLQGGAEKLSGTLLGQLSNLQDAIRVHLADTATPLNEQLTKEIKPITDVAIKTIDKIGPPVFRLVGILATGLQKALPIIAPLLGLIVDGFGRLVTAASPLTKALEPVSGRLGKAITRLFDQLVKAAPDLIDLFVALVQILPDFVELLSQLVPLVLPLARLATTLLDFGPSRVVIDGLLISLLAYKALSGVVQTLQALGEVLRFVGIQSRFAASAPPIATPGVGPAAAGGGAASKVPLVGGVLAAIGLGFLDARAGVRIVKGVQKKGFHLQNPFAKHKGDASNSELFGQLFGDVQGNLGRSARVHSLAAGMGSGATRVTSTVRDFGVAGAGSGHLRGTAWDVAADRPQEYAGNIRALGGYATVHDTGAGRHVHAQIGDTLPPPRSGGASGASDAPIQVVVQIDRVYGQVDFEAGVANAISSARRRRITAGHKDESRF